MKSICIVILFYASLKICFESNALKMASVSMYAFLKLGPEIVHDLPQHLHRDCSHFILNLLF